MQAFKFLHCGDLHLGAPFHYVTCPGKIVPQAVAEATYKALNRMVELALLQEVNFVLITGDIYNSEDHNLEAQIRFVRAMEALEKADIPVFMIQGNHDPAESWQAQVPLPDNVHVFNCEPDGGYFADRYPLVIGGQEIGGLYGLSLGHGNEYQDLSSFYTPADSDQFSIALLHASLGASEDGRTVGPTYVDSLIERGMDYWALGHIHKRQIVQEAPYIVYAGNTQGLHKKEVGPKGCYIVEVASNGQCSPIFYETQAIRFEQARINIQGLEKEADIVEMIRHKRDMLRTQVSTPVLMEVVLEGAGSLHNLCGHQEARQVWLQEAQEDEKMRQHFIMPYEIVDRTRPAIDLASRRGLGDMVADYLAAYDRTASDVGSLRAIVEARPEFKRLGLYGDYLTDDMLARAWSRAEAQGATQLLGDDDEH